MRGVPESVHELPANQSRLAAPISHALVIAIGVGIGLQPLYVGEPTLFAPLAAALMLPFLVRIGLWHSLDIRARHGTNDRWLRDAAVRVRGEGERRVVIVDGVEYPAADVRVVVTHYTVRRTLGRAERYFYSTYLVAGDIAHQVLHTKTPDEAERVALSIASDLELGAPPYIEHEPVSFRTLSGTVTLLAALQVVPMSIMGYVLADASPRSWAIGIACALLGHLGVLQLEAMMRRKTSNERGQALVGRVRSEAATTKPKNEGNTAKKKKKKKKKTEEKETSAD